MAVIFWFSGTGNSLYAAKNLAEGIGGAELVRVTDDAPAGSYGGEGEKVGFVIPSYYCNLPRAVSTFIEKADIRPGSYIFGVVTMGKLGQGTVSALAKALKAKGLRLSYGKGVKMPANYVAMYNPADKLKVAEELAETDILLSGFAGEIAEGAEALKGFPFIGKKLYKNIPELDKAFFYRDVCIGCYLCEKICPVRNIQMDGDRPKWLGKCEHCMACISWCPVKAIEYGEKTRERRRYRNPKINASELSARE